MPPDPTPLDRARALPFWSGPVEPQPLGGGITNLNFLVEDAGRRVVVRIGADIPEHGVMRFNELAASRAAHAAGVSPAVLHAGPGFLVLEHIDGRTLGPQEVREPARLPRVLALVARAHREIPRHLRGPTLAFWVFHVVRDYAARLADAASPHAALMPELLAAAEALEAAVGPVELVFAHNDLLAANLIEDGERLWLIDWDYAGWGSALFDLGGLAANNGLSEADEEWMLATYHGRPPDDGLRRRYRAMKCAAALREAMWSMVSELHSGIEFDFAAYTATNLARFHAALAELPELRPMPDLPASVRTVIVGGGIVGCSVAYHLAKRGRTDTVLLERAKLTSGSTWHAAGLVGQLRSNANITELLGYSVELYRRLEAETGQATGWKMNGGLRLACTPERWTEVRRQATTARSFGLEMHLLTPPEARDLWPPMDAADVVGAAFLPTDGQASPSDIAQALAKGARQGGVAIHEDTPITRVLVEDGRVGGVETPRGRIACAEAVLCAGQWTRALAAEVGVAVPLVSVEHQYMMTEPIEGVAPTLPTLRDPDRLTYWKEEVGGLVMGGYEPDPIPWAVDRIPEGFAFRLLDSNWDHFEQFMERAIGRVPALATAGVKQLVNGPESFTPDGNFILGEAPEVRGLFVGAGFNAFGIASGGGAGMALAEWVATGSPPFDLWPVDIRRFGRPHGDIAYVRARTLEAYGRHYAIAWPAEEYVSARPCRRSALYDRLKAKGACFGEKLGWERPNWFAGPGETPQDAPTFGRPDWFGAVAREHRATREAAALFDQSSFAKFLVTGPDAAAALDAICAGDVTRPPGRVTYTQMLNDRGGIECDLTVTRTAPSEFYLVTGTGFATHDLDWIRRGIPTGANAHVADVTSAFGTLALMGPQARAILERVARDDVSNAGFPFGAARRIHVAGAPVLALRLTYVGELGWELHVPTESVVAVYEALTAAGQDLGLVDAGYRAIESLRLEKGYRAWGADIGPDHTPLEAGLGWAVARRPGRAFRGRAAVEAQARDGVKQLLAGFTLRDREVMLWGRETILRDGAPVGWLSSAGFGHTLGRPIGYGYVRRADGVTSDFVLGGRYELEVAAERHPADVHLRPPYDPGSERVRA